MKIVIIFILSLFYMTGLAQNTGVKTATFSVKGNCDECKKRIENAADIKGVKLAEWNEKKQLLTVTYKADKVTPEEIEKAIAASGHDAGNTKSSPTNYNKLPDCCKYRDTKHDSSKK